MYTEYPEPTPQGEQPPRRPAEARLADVIMQLTDEVSRAKMETFLHFARDCSKITVHLEPSRDHAIRFILSYPSARG